MKIKNLYECNENCKNCTYEFKKPTGYTVLDECCTDNCPHNNYKIGNVDKLGGRHVEGYGWNPLGEYCKECTHSNCDDCVKWSNRDKKLRNNIPPILKNPPVNKSQTITAKSNETIKSIVPNNNAQDNIVIESTTNADISEKITQPKENSATELVAKVKEIINNNGKSPLYADKPIIKPNNPFDFDFDDKKESLFEKLDIDDVEDLFGQKSINEVNVTPASDDIEYGIIEQSSITITDDFFPTEPKFDVVEIAPDETLSTELNNVSLESENVEEEQDDEDYSDDDIDFGMGDSFSEPDDTFSDYDNVSFDGDDDYEIPMPDEYMEDLEILANAQKEMYTSDDDEDEDFDEDDDAQFELFEQTKKLKHSILFAPETKIAKYQVRNKGLYLSVSGEAKVTVKGRNDSDGFSYCDANRFPRYVREGILSGELYENPNISITDNTTFCFVYFEIENGEEILKQESPYIQSIDNATEDKIRKVLKKAFDSIVN